MHLVARRAAEFGVEIAGDVRFNLRKAVARKDQIVAGIHKGIYGALERRKEAITFLRGQAKFLNEHEIDTGDRRLSFDKAIIATGARRQIPPIQGLEQVDYLTNESALQPETLPNRLVVVGGGYVGIEFAQMYGRFGTQVTLLGRNTHLAPGEDPELADLLAGYLREEGLDVYTDAPVLRVRQDGAGTIVTARIDNAEREFACDALLLATGRVGNTDTLGLVEAGVLAEKRGFVSVNEQLQTSQPNIWAIGDVKGGWMFTHVATYDGPLAALNAVKDQGRTIDYRVVPRAIFSSPTLAAIGLTVQEAQAQGYDVLVGEASAVGGRSHAIGDTRGKLKAVVNKANDEILGFHVLAPHGDDLLHEAVTAMHGNGTIDRISKSIHVHPTLSELVKSAARAAR
ncbi:MAG: FAD-dependent oxidoreductase [Caldilineaceae bacterium]|nr:FAD-dependent oxidoreductase [Caldilineaceae bacterium]